jgi:ubiquinone/menaquinone biosynthesis C-methylase UbiE
MSKTSWESSASWYENLVGNKGHYYHTHVIFPKLDEMLSFTKTTKQKYLDLACGQGVFARLLPKEVHYTGVDISSSLIQEAKKRKTNCSSAFTLGDITKELPIKEEFYDTALCILALQNVQNTAAVFSNAYKALKPGGKWIIVLNHPAFRIPRRSHWYDDPKQNRRSRLLECYLSPQEIPLLTHPGQGKKSPITWSYHYPISHYINVLAQEGFYTLRMQELCSDKESEGAAAKRENYIRKEIPLFLVIEAQKPLA